MWRLIDCRVRNWPCNPHGIEPDGEGFTKSKKLRNLDDQWPN